MVYFRCSTFRKKHSFTYSAEIVDLEFTLLILVLRFCTFYTLQDQLFWIIFWRSHIRPVSYLCAVVNTLYHNIGNLRISVISTLTLHDSYILDKRTKKASLRWSRIGQSVLVADTSNSFNKEASRREGNGKRLGFRPEWQCTSLSLN
jgi:hypothetical protein